MSSRSFLSQAALGAYSDAMNSPSRFARVSQKSGFTARWHQ